MIFPPAITTTDILIYWFFTFFLCLPLYLCIYECYMHAWVYYCLHYLTTCTPPPRVFIETLLWRRKVPWTTGIPKVHCKCRLFFILETNFCLPLPSIRIYKWNSSQGLPGKTQPWAIQRLCSSVTDFLFPGNIQILLYDTKTASCNTTPHHSQHSLL